jgi:hypothetical protein
VSRPTLTIVLAAMPLLLSCEREPTQPSEMAADNTPAFAAAAETASLYAPRFNPDDFVRNVDNRFYPLTPGTRYVYVGEEDGESEKNVVLVTHDRKRILGVSAIVVLDQVFVHGKIKEKTFDWFAQDSRGNVWYLGEDTKEFEDGKVVSTEGSWEAGVDGAVPGIIMPAHPQVGQHYRQEFLRGEAEDEAKILTRGLDISVPYGSFRSCLRTVEWTRLEPGVREAKLYCPHLGFVKGRGVKGSDARLVLKRVFN